MTGSDLRRYYKILEIEEGATLQEIEHAYRMLKRIHSSDSAAMVPGMQEFSETRRLELLDAIEEAHRVLETQLKTHSHTAISRNRKLEPGIPVTGEIFFMAREEIGVELEEVSRRTKVRKDYLQALEMEDFDRLPEAAVYVRGFAVAYAEYLGFTAEDIIPAYMLRYNNWLATKKKK
ncbi:MAG: hypothetical protein DRJ08_05240 [Acidobacteria bacterium]|nr:MAG: hypothetical protein DRJ08_05240 [Acidobacteriota bacterium]